jgi:hypothetical protein
LSKEWEPWEDLPPDKENEIIEQIAQFCVKNRIGIIGQMVFETISPVSKMFSEIAMNLYWPFLGFLGIDKLTAIFRKKQNIQRIINRIEELEEVEHNKPKLKR